MKPIIPALVAIGLLSGSLEARATQLIQNGSFSQLTNGLGEIDNNTKADGWSSDGYNFVFSNGNQSVNGSYGGLRLWTKFTDQGNTWDGSAPRGSNFVAMDGDFQTQPVTQTINGLTVGQTYHLNFDYAFGQQTGFSGATVQHLTAKVGNSAWTSKDFNVGNHGFTGWQKESFSFTATSSSELLSFLAYGNKPVPPFAMLTNVSLNAGVPESSTWALMLLGVGSLGALSRLRRTATVSAG